MNLIQLALKAHDKAAALKEQFPAWSEQKALAVAQSHKVVVLVRRGQ
jgi:hypothetical protein